MPSIISAAIEPDETIIGRLGLETNGFFLLVGTMKPNKNLDFAIRAFEALGDPDQKLVVVGGTAPTVFKSDGPESNDHMLFPGRLSDAKLPRSSATPPLSSSQVSMKVSASHRSRP